MKMRFGREGINAKRPAVAQLMPSVFRWNDLLELPCSAEPCSGALYFHIKRDPEVSTPEPIANCRRLLIDSDLELFCEDGTTLLIIIDSWSY